MRQYKMLAMGVIALVAVLTASNLAADQRSYVWTYEYLTVPRRQAELETYFTLSSLDQGRFTGNTGVEHRIEFEVGMTDRFDFAVYQIFEQAPEQDLRYKGFQLRARYRFGEKGKYLLDPLIYVEYKGVGDLSEHALETKLILAKDLGRFNLALNPIVEFEFGPDGEAEPEYAVALSYGVSKLLRFGLEAKGSENGHYIGPVISHGGRYWVALGSAFKISDISTGKPEAQIRLLMGFDL